MPIDKAKYIETDWNSIQHQVRTMCFTFQDLVDILHGVCHRSSALRLVPHLSRSTSFLT